MAETAKQFASGDSPSIDPELTALPFIQTPIHFLRTLKPSVFMVLCGILVDRGWSGRFIRKTNREIMKDCGLKISAVAAGLRDLNDRGIITSSFDENGERIIELNWTLASGQARNQFSGQLITTEESGNGSDPLRQTDTPPCAKPTYTPCARPKGGARQTEGGRAPRRIPPLRQTQTPSYLTFLEQGSTNEEQQQDTESLLLLSRDGIGDGVDADDGFLDERLPSWEVEQLTQAVQLMTGIEQTRFKARLFRHDMAVARLGPLQDPEPFPAVKILARLVERARENPAGGIIRQDRTTGRWKESHP